MYLLFKGRLLSQVLVDLIIVRSSLQKNGIKVKSQASVNLYHSLPVTIKHFQFI